MKIHIPSLAALLLQNSFRLSAGDGKDGIKFPKKDNDFGQTPEGQRFAVKNPSMINPVQIISKGSGEVAILEHHPNQNDWIDTEVFVDSMITPGETKTFPELFNNEMKTDGIVILWKNQIIYEKYFDGQTPETKHYMFSATKSYLGLTASLLAYNDPTFQLDKTVAEYIPEMKNTGVGDATVRQVMDMSTEYAFEEKNRNPDIENQLVNDLEVEGKPFKVYPEIGLGLLNIVPPRFPESLADKMKDHGTYDTVPKNSREFYTYLEPTQDNSKHGDKFTYRSPNTDILGWILDNHLGGVGESVKYFEKNIWSKLGMESDAFIAVDQTYFPRWWQGSSVTTRDAARFGQMMLKGGINQFGERILPQVVVDDIIQGGTQENLDQYSYDQWFKAYRNQFWVRPNHYFAQDGAHGQLVWVDIKADLVIALQQSWLSVAGDYVGSSQLPILHDQRLAFYVLGEYLQKQGVQKSTKQSKGTKMSKSKSN